MEVKKLTFELVLLVLIKSAEFQVMRPPGMVNNIIYFPYNHLNVRPNQRFINRPMGSLNPGQHINRLYGGSSFPYQFPNNQFNERLTPYNLALIRQMNKQMVDRMMAGTNRPSLSHTETNIPDEYFNKIENMPNTEESCSITQSTDVMSSKGTERPLKLYPNGQITLTTKSQVSNPLSQTTHYHKPNPLTNSHDGIFHSENATPDDNQENPINETSEDNSEDIDIRGSFD